MKHYLEDKKVWCVHPNGHKDEFHLEQEDGSSIYDENNNCVECMEYFFDPHLPNCKYSDAEVLV